MALAEEIRALAEEISDQSRGDSLHDPPVSLALLEVEPQQPPLVIHAALRVVLDVLQREAAPLVDHRLAVVEALGHGQAAGKLANVHGGAGGVSGESPVEAVVGRLQVVVVAAEDEQFCLVEARVAGALEEKEVGLAARADVDGGPQALLGTEELDALLAGLHYEVPAAEGDVGAAPPAVRLDLYLAGALDHALDEVEVDGVVLVLRLPVPAKDEDVTALVLAERVAAAGGHLREVLLADLAADVVAHEERALRPPVELHQPAREVDELARLRHQRGVEGGHDELADRHHPRLAALPPLHLHQVQPARPRLEEVQQPVPLLRLRLHRQARAHAVVPLARIFRRHRVPPNLRPREASLAGGSRLAGRGDPDGIGEGGLEELYVRTGVPGLKATQNSVFLRRASQATLSFSKLSSSPCSFSVSVFLMHSGTDRLPRRPSARVEQASFSCSIMPSSLP